MTNRRWFQLRPARHEWLIVAGLIGMLAVAGCSSGGGNTMAPPPPPTGPTDTEPNDFTAQSLGTLGTEDIVVNGNAANDGDVDLYQVTLAGTTNLFVHLNWSSGANLGFAVSNGNGIMVQNVDTASKPEQCTLGSVPAGTYTVRVGSRTNAATTYVLTIGPR